MESIPEHRTRILPLRWFANACNLYPAYWALSRALRHEDEVEYTDLPLSKAGHRWWRLYHFFNRPYDKWGTIYRLEKDKQ
jgi:VanZ family protein